MIGNVASLLTRPAGLGALEYLARLALGPLILLLISIGFWQGWGQAWTPAALVMATVLLAVRWRDFSPVKAVGEDPGGLLAPLTKLVMVASLLLVPLMAADGEYLVMLAVLVMAVASAGLWRGWRWAGWAWIAYSIVAMAGWLGELVGLVVDSTQAPERLPMDHWKPLLASLPSALFAGAVLTWVLEWRRRPQKQPASQPLEQPSQEA